MILLLQTSGFAQNENDDKIKDKIKMGDGDEIIIKRKGDKDSKVTVEIKNGDLLINGKPADEFEDDNLSVRKRSDDDVFAFAPRSPFRGGTWSWNGEELGDSKTAFLGVSSEKSDKGGAEVREVTKGSAAEKMGLKKGDVITKIDNTTIDDPEDLTKAVRAHKPDDKIVITYKRDGKIQSSTTTLGKVSINVNKVYRFNVPNMNENFDLITPPAAPYPHPYAYSWNSNGPKIGIKAQDTEDGKGVKVLDVDDESPAEKAGIKEGDVITQFDGKEVNGAGQLVELARAAKTKPSVKVKLNRGGKIQDVDLKIPRKLKTADL